MKVRVLVTAIAAASLGLIGSASAAINSVPFTPGTAPWAVGSSGPPSFPNGDVTWVGVDRWLQDGAGNGWISGNVFNTPNISPTTPAVRTSGGGITHYAGTVADLAGTNSTSATISSDFLWRKYGATSSNGQTWPVLNPLPGFPQVGMTGTAMLSLELNGFGVALTVINDQGTSSPHWDMQQMDLSNNLTSGTRAASIALGYPGYDTRDQLLQLLQYDNAGNVKVLATQDLVQLTGNPQFRVGNDGAGDWPAATRSQNSLSLDGNVVNVSFTNGAFTWNPGPFTLSSLGGTVTGEQAIWGSGSYMFKSGGDSATAWISASLTAVPEPASLSLLVIGAGLLGVRRRRGA